MSIDVTCPNCQAGLKAPAGMAGKKAKCKKCQTSFRVPGGEPAAADSVGESLQLSVADIVPAVKAVATSADPFAFDPAEAAAEATPAPGKALSQSKYRTKPGGPAPKKGGPGKWVLLAGAVAVVAGGGGAAAVYFTMNANKPATAQPAPAAAPAPAPAPDPAATDKGKAAGKDKAEKPKKADAAPKPGAAAKRAAVTLTGGTKLPPPPADAKVYAKAKLRATLDTDAAKARRVLFANDEAALAAVVSPSFGGFQGKGAKDAVERFSTTTGKKIDRVEVDADGGPGAKAADLSQDGNRFANESPAGKLTVWDLNAKAKLLDGVDAGTPDAKGKPGGLAAVYFLADDKLAVVTHAGAVDVWDLKAKAKVVAGSPLSGLKPDEKLADRRTVALAPDKTGVLAYAGGAVVEIPFADGKAKSPTQLPRAGGEGLALAVNGGRAVVAYRATQPGPHILIAVVVPGDDKTQAEIHLADDAGTPAAAAWTAQDSILVVTDKGVAIALDAEVNKLVAAVYPPAPSAVVTPVALGGEVWYLYADPADAKKAVLARVPYPPDDNIVFRNAGAEKPIGLQAGPDGLMR